MTRRQCRF